MTAPNSTMGESIPEMNMLIVSSREKLVLLGMSSKGPYFVDMTSNDLLKVELKSSLKNGILGGSQYQLAAFALCDCAYRS